MRRRKGVGSELGSEERRRKGVGAGVFIFLSLPYSPGCKYANKSDDDKSVLESIQKEKISMFNQMIAILPLKAPQNVEMRNAK